MNYLRRENPRTKIQKIHVNINVLIGECLSESPLSREEWELAIDNMEPLAKRGYILHNLDNGNPRYRQ